jgi:hypothetical protein
VFDVYGFSAPQAPPHRADARARQGTALCFPRASRCAPPGPRANARPSRRRGSPTSATPTSRRYPPSSRQCWPGSAHGRAVARGGGGGRGERCRVPVLLGSHVFFEYFNPSIQILFKRASTRSRAGPAPQGALQRQSPDDQRSPSSLAASRFVKRLLSAMAWSYGLCERPGDMGTRCSVRSRAYTHAAKATTVACSKVQGRQGSVPVGAVNPAETAQAIDGLHCRCAMESLAAARTKTKFLQENRTRASNRGGPEEDQSSEHSRLQ